MHEQPKALLIDPSRRDFEKSLDALQPTTGFCIFADIADSTAMKDSSVKLWIVYICNIFRNIQTFLPGRPLKAIGDQLMYFIPDSQLQETGTTPLGMFDALAKIAREPDEEHYFKNTRIAVAYCLDSYAITFVPGGVDYYGKDIDLTARLLTKAKPREIVMNEPFREMVTGRYKAIANKEQFFAVTQIEGPKRVKFKGFDDDVPIYTLPYKKDEDDFGSAQCQA
jgi:class 3 adenylate cyclase